MVFLTSRGVPEITHVRSTYNAAIFLV